MQKAIGKRQRQEAKGKGKRQEAKGKRQEAKGKRQGGPPRLVASSLLAGPKFGGNRPRRRK